MGNCEKSMEKSLKRACFRSVDNGKTVENLPIIEKKRNFAKVLFVIS